MTYGRSGGDRFGHGHGGVHCVRRGKIWIQARKPPAQWDLWDFSLRFWRGSWRWKRGDSLIECSASFGWKPKWIWAYAYSFALLTQSDFLFRVHLVQSYHATSSACSLPLGPAFFFLIFKRFRQNWSCFDFYMTCIGVL